LSTISSFKGNKNFTAERENEDKLLSVRFLKASTKRFVAFVRDFFFEFYGLRLEIDSRGTIFVEKKN
jgi:hypothetical protein